MAPIGVFDSGVGGLTVLKKLGQAFPHQSWIYLGDTARLPYGSKSGLTIKTYTEENLAFLEQFQCKAYIIACNSASTQFPADQFNGIPVYKVIKPGALSALQTTRNKRIGVIGTKATVSSHVYEDELKKLGYAGEIYTQACPLFVPLVEEGLFDDTVMDLIIARYLIPMKDFGIDTLILGCTHYTLLSTALQRFFGSAVKLVSSETHLIQILNQSHNVEENSEEHGRITVYTTDRVEFVADLAKTILADIMQSIDFKNLSR